MPTPTEKLIEKLEKYEKYVIKREDYECWEFTGCVLADGKGRVRISGKVLLAHRVAYELAYGPVPRGKFVIHSCENGRCCNPMHLRLGGYRSRHRRSLPERLRKFVTLGKISECWDFSGGSRHKFGYGLMRIDGKMVGAHRAAYEAAVGPIPPGKHILHSCDRPICCNPAHLRVGTSADNVDDRDYRGRTAKGPERATLQRKICRRGSNHQDAKLDERKVRFARKAYSEGRFSQQELADRYGVSQAAMSSALLRKTWTHI